MDTYEIHKGGGLFRYTVWRMYTATAHYPDCALVTVTVTARGARRAVRRDKRRRARGVSIERIAA